MTGGKANAMPGVLVLGKNIVEPTLAKVLHSFFKESLLTLQPAQMSGVNRTLIGKQVSSLILQRIAPDNPARTLVT
jgi:hypothetical protein